MWGCFGFVLLFALLAFVIWLVDPSLRRLRAFEREVLNRAPVSDEAIFSQYFSTDEVPPDVPGRVRKVFAWHMGYPIEKLLPDDDLAVYWQELDMIDVIRALEKEFGVTITDADAADVPHCTIRAVSHLIARKSDSPAPRPRFPSI